MAEDIPQVSIVATRQIFKFAEGVDPDVGEPFEVLNHEETLTGQEAIDYIKALGGDINGLT